MRESHTAIPHAKAWTGEIPIFEKSPAIMLLVQYLTGKRGGLPVHEKSFGTASDDGNIRSSEMATKRSEGTTVFSL